MPRPAPAGAPATQFRGVSWDEGKGMWRARIYVGKPRRQIYIGRFATDRDAAQAFDCFSVLLRSSQGPNSTSDGLNFSPAQAAREMPRFDRRRRRLCAHVCGHALGARLFLHC